MFRPVLSGLMILPALAAAAAAEPEAAASAVAAAAPPASSASAPARARLKPPRISTIPDAAYPQGLLPGIESEADLAVSVTETGNVDKVELLKSSGFPPLDEAAIALLKQATFIPAQDGEGRPMPRRVRVPYGFVRSPDPLERPCAGLSNEVKEFQRFHPELKRDEIRSVKMPHGMILLVAMQKGNFSMGMMAGAQALTDLVIDECIAQPDLTVAKAVLVVTEKGRK